MTSGEEMKLETTTTIAAPATLELRERNLSACVSA
jgi:hypothetical protein